VVCWVILAVAVVFFCVLCVFGGDRACCGVICCLPGFLLFRFGNLFGSKVN